MRSINNPPLIYQRPFNSFPMLEASGAAAGHAQDASAGLNTMTDASNAEWAWNPGSGEWQMLHTIASGDTLWKLSGLYYGTSSLDGVHAIYDVPQNKAIQGPSADSGLIPGDVILIPGLPQPSTAPAAADAVPQSLPQVPTGIFTLPTAAGSPLPAPVPSGAPDNWDPTTPYPPVNAPSGGAIVLPTTYVTGDDAPMTVGSSSTPTTTSATPFWTHGRIAVAAGAGVIGLGTVVWLMTRKKKGRRAA